jgi:hypothetical protein
VKYPIDSLLTSYWLCRKLLIPQTKSSVSTDRTRTCSYFLQPVIVQNAAPTLTDIMLKEIMSCATLQRTDIGRCLVYTRKMTCCIKCYNILCLMVYCSSASVYRLSQCAIELLANQLTPNKGILKSGTSFLRGVFRFSCNNASYTLIHKGHSDHMKGLYEFFFLNTNWNVQLIIR